MPLSLTASSSFCWNRTACLMTRPSLERSRKRKHYYKELHSIKENHINEKKIAYIKREGKRGGEGAIKIDNSLWWSRDIQWVLPLGLISDDSTTSGAQTISEFKGIRKKKKRQHIQNVCEITSSKPTHIPFEMFLVFGLWFEPRL